MCTPTVDIQRLSLLVQRLIDTDLLLPEEGSAYLAEIAAFATAQDEVAMARASAESERFLPILEALLRNARLDVSIGGKAKEILRRILHGAAETA